MREQRPLVDRAGDEVELKRLVPVVAEVDTDETGRHGNSERDHAIAAPRCATATRPTLPRPWLVSSTSPSDNAPVDLGARASYCSRGD